MEQAVSFYANVLVRERAVLFPLSPPKLCWLPLAIDRAISKILNSLTPRAPPSPIIKSCEIVDSCINHSR